VQGDAASLQDLDALYRVVKETKGRLDILFCKRWIRRASDDRRRHGPNIFHRLSTSTSAAAVRRAEGAAAHEECASIILTSVDRGSGSGLRRIEVYSTARWRRRHDNGAEGIGRTRAHGPGATALRPIHSTVNEVRNDRGAILMSGSAFCTANSSPRR